MGTTWWQGCGELLLQDNCFCKVMAVSQEFIFYFKCYSILHFAVGQLLCWAFLLSLSLVKHSAFLCVHYNSAHALTCACVIVCVCVHLRACVYRRPDGSVWYRIRSKLGTKDLLMVTSHWAHLLLVSRLRDISLIIIDRCYLRWFISQTIELK